MRMCVLMIYRIEIHNLMESCDQVLIKVKDSAPTVICTLAIKIAKHREEGGGEFCKTRHTGKILISFSSTLRAESALDHAGPGWAVLNSQCTEFFLSSIFFVVMLEIVGSLKLISHPRHSNILGGGGWGVTNTIQNSCQHH